MSKLNIANLITLSRIFGVVYLFWLMPFASEKIQLVVIALFTLIALTDLLDGWLARRLKSVSELGKVLDPLADKILLLILLPLVSMGVIKPFPVFLIFAREFAVMGLRVLSAKYKFNVAASLSGKIKTGITLPICGILLVRPVVIEMQHVPLFLKPIVNLKRWMFSWPDSVYEALIWLVVGVTILSFIDYMCKFIWQRQCAIHNHDQAKVKQALLTYIPNSFSIANVVFGLAAIIYVFVGDLQVSGACILLGMLCDGLDGRIARKLNAFSKIGEKMDTTADYLTFGIAPAVVMYAYVSGELSIHSGLAIALALSFFASVRFRLKRFEESGHQANFTGLPSPIGALFFVASMFSFLSAYPWVFVGLNIVNMWLMVSTLQYPHNETAHKKPFFQYLKAPVLLLIIAIILRFLGVPALNEATNNVLLGLMVIYLSAPLIKDRPDTLV